MEQFFLIIHVLAALTLIGLVLLQQGRGADAGAAFGSGSSGTLFGARGPASFLTRITAILAAVFFLTSIALAYIVTHSEKRESVIERLEDDKTQPIRKEDISIPPAPPGSQPVGSQSDSAAFPDSPGEANVKSSAPKTSGPDIPPAPTKGEGAAASTEVDLAPENHSASRDNSPAAASRGSVNAKDRKGSEE